MPGLLSLQESCKDSAQEGGRRSTAGPISHLAGESGQDVGHERWWTGYKLWKIHPRLLVYSILPPWEFCRRKDRKCWNCIWNEWHLYLTRSTPAANQGAYFTCSYTLQVCDAELPCSCSPCFFFTSLYIFYWYFTYIFHLFCWIIPLSLFFSSFCINSSLLIPKSFFKHWEGDICLIGRQYPNDLYLVVQ